MLSRKGDVFMSVSGPGGTSGPDSGAQRWGAEQEQIERMAQQKHLVDEVERIHAEEAAEEGRVPPAKRPWWKFWAKD